jgi:hypothetical protein
MKSTAPFLLTICPGMKKERYVDRAAGITDLQQAIAGTQEKNP